MSNPFSFPVDPNPSDFPTSPDNPWNLTIHQQIVSTVSHILQNISYHLLLINGTNFLDLTTSVMDPSTSNMSNLTFAMFSETFERYATGHPSLDPGTVSYLLLQTLFQLGPYLQYFATFVSILVGGWGCNRLTLKSELVTDVLETVISFLIFLPALPGIAFFFLGIFGARTLAFLYLRANYPPNKFSLLNGVDGFWAYEAYASCSSCLGLYIIEGVCDIDKIRARMKKTVESDLVGGKMSRKLTTFWGFATWETIPSEEISMERHVKVVGGKEDNCLGEEGVFQVMRTIQDKPVTGRAPWTVYVIPRFAYQRETGGDPSKTHYAIIYRLHHSIMDGKQLSIHLSCNFYKKH